MAGRLMLVAAAGLITILSPARASAGPPRDSAMRGQDKNPPKVVFDIPPIGSRVEIDGRKNPEMIPQWDVWHAAFEIFVKVSDLPTEVLKDISKDEAGVVLDAAKEDAKNLLACQERVLKLMPTLQTDEARFINERTREINLEYRKQVLALRDRVLGALRPPGQVALGKYVESLKAGMRVFVPKAELGFYRQPE